MIISSFGCILSGLYHFFKGPDRNCASPIKWSKWPAWICWIYFRHPMGSLEVLWSKFYFWPITWFFASQLLISWIFSLILNIMANPVTEPIRINLYICLKKFKMLLFQPIVAKSALIGWFIIFIENRSSAPIMHNHQIKIH